MSILKKAIQYLLLSLSTIFYFLNGKNFNDKTVLIVSNGMSMSGAPLVLQSVVNYFQNNGYEPIIVYEHDGKLRKRSKCMTKCCFFFEYIIQYLAMKHKYDYVFVNTIASYRWIRYLERRQVRYNLWIHEGNEYFSKYQDKLPQEIKFGKVFCVSDISVECLKKYKIACREKVFLCYPYSKIDDADNFNFDNRKKKIILVGSICKRKNQIELLRAIDNIDRRVIEKVEVYFIGSPIEKDYWEIFSKKIEHLDYIKYIDYMKNEDLMKFYSDVYLTICTSVDDPMPVTITESAFKKRLVLISSGSGQYQFLKESGYPLIYTTNNVEELSATIELALSFSLDEYKEKAEEAFNVLCDKFSLFLFVQTLDKELVRE